MNFNFMIINGSGTQTIHSGGNVQLNHYIQDNFHVLPTNMSFTYDLIGNPNVVFGNGTRRQVNGFPHNNPVENFVDTISLTSTDGQNHYVKVTVTCDINGDQVQRYVDVNIFFP